VPDARARLGICLALLLPDTWSSPGFFRIEHRDPDLPVAICVPIARFECCAICPQFQPCSLGAPRHTSDPPVTQSCSRALPC